MSRVFLFCSLVILLIVCMPVLAAEPYVTGWYEPVTEGYRLHLTVHNPLVDEVVTNWYVATGDATGPFGPAGWTVSQNSREVSWYTPDPVRQVQPGQHLGGFGFGVRNTTSVLGWWMWSSRTGGHVGWVTPSFVPEPSSLLALEVGGFGILGAALRRRIRPKG